MEKIVEERINSWLNGAYDEETKKDEIEKKIDNASLFIASEGGYKAYINGRVIGFGNAQPGGDYGNCESLKYKFFEKYIGCSQSVCSKWFKGERKLNEEQLRKTHEFLSGGHIKKVEDIMKEE